MVILMKKKMLIVINTMGRAGAERVLVSLLKTIPPDIFDIDLFAVIERGEFFAEVPKHVNILNKAYSCDSMLDKKAKSFLTKKVLKSMIKRLYGLSYIPYFFKNIALQKKRGDILFDKLFWKALADTAPRFSKEYDLAIAFTEGASTYYVKDRVKAKKIAAYVHIDYLKAGYMKELDKDYYEKYDAIYCVSQIVREVFCKVYPEYENKTEVFQNILIPSEIKEKARMGKGFEDNFNGTRLLTVARLHPQKALDISVAAFKLITEMGYDNVRWYVLGDGTERKMLEELIEENKLSGKFILLGASPNPYPFFEQCDIYIQASHFEGWSISIAEALILQKPTIITDVAGSREQVINNETGILIDLSPENLAVAIKSLLDSEELRKKFSENLAKNNLDYAKDLKKLYELAGLDSE